MIDYIESMTPLTITRTNSEMTADDIVDTYNYQGIYGEGSSVKHS